MIRVPFFTKLHKDCNYICESQEHLHNKYNRYAMLFYACETSNLFIVLSQILVINKFLNYQFLSYGLQVYQSICHYCLKILIMIGVHLVLTAA